MIAFVREADPESLCRKAGERLSALLRAAAHDEKPVLFLASGGSSLALPDYADPKTLGPHCTLGVLDDRGSPDPDINNFLKLSSSKFGRAARDHGCSFIDTAPQAKETIAQTAERFEKNVRGWKEKNPDGRVIITMGMGSDGHIAGIMPFPEAPDLFEKLFNDSGRWVTGYDAGGKNPYPKRITVTLPFMKELVDYAVVYIGSVDKKPALEKALADGARAEIPAQVMQDMKNVEIYSVFEVKASA